MAATLTRRQMLASTAPLACFAAGMRAEPDGRVHLRRLPEGGIQPQAAVDSEGALHVLYYSGDAFQGDLFYVRTASSVADAAFTAPIRVNSQQGSAIAAGTIRGGQLAIGKQGRVHVAWNGSQTAKPPGPLNPDSGKPGAPMLYSRLNSSGSGFEPQRNLMLRSFGLDGGGSIAADREGNVYVAWHGISESDRRPAYEGEARRIVWITKSIDNGNSFAEECKAWSRPTGACGCCGMKIFANNRGNVFALYRSATESIHRDIYLLASSDHGRSFTGRLVDKWEVDACPMSSMDIDSVAGVTVATWETEGQSYWTKIIEDGTETAKPVAAPGEGKGRKHPRLAINQNGDLLLVCTEGTGWKKGGGFAWQLYHRDGRPIGSGERPHDIPVWSFAAAVARPDGGFTILY